MTSSRSPRRPHVVRIEAPSFPTLPKPRVYKTIAYTFIGIVVVVILGILWLSSARATIVISAKQESVQLDAMVQVAKTPEQGQLPGRVVQGVFRNIQEFQTAALASSTDMTAAAIGSAPVTPQVQGGSTSSTAKLIAKGKVRIVNKYSRSQTLVQVTRLLTADKKLYRIDRTITILPGQEVSVGVYADQPGEEFAIGPTTFTIPGLFVDLQQYIYAVSDQAFVAVPDTTPSAVKTSGSVATKTKTVSAKPTGPIVTSAEIEEAQKQLTATTLEKAKQTLAADIGDPRFGEVQYLVRSVEQKTNVSPGQAADKFLASVALEVTAVYYPKDDMLILIRQKLKEKIPEGKELLPFGSEAVTYSIESTDAKGEISSIRVLVNGAYRLTPLSPALKKSLFAGKSKTEVMGMIRSIPGVDDVEITTKPGWYGKVPSLQDHIDISVK